MKSAPGVSWDHLHEGCLPALGTILSLEDVTGNEIPNRIGIGWRKFWALKCLLLNRKTSVIQRLKLFDKTVGGAVLWSCQSWALRVSEKRQLQTAQNAMLRRIVFTNRAVDEDWVSWIRRATAKANEMRARAGARNWCLASACLKWSWAGHVARRSPSTWLNKVVQWRDAEWTAFSLGALGSNRPLRPSRRRWMK